MINYSFLNKDKVDLYLLRNISQPYSCFISAYDNSDRVKEVFLNINAQDKKWFSFLEYGLDSDNPQDAYIPENYIDESDYMVHAWFDLLESSDLTKPCIDITGFIGHHLMFLIKVLQEKGIKKFDALYSEPIRYALGQATEFTSGVVLETRQVKGFQGSHDLDTTSDLLIINSGYDDILISHVGEHKSNAAKIQIFGFPSLKADFYQENVFRASKAEEDVTPHVGEKKRFVFAPSYDPFATAEVLRETVKKRKHEKGITNLYLSPLATKSQLLGFSIYYLWDLFNKPASIIMPICEQYRPDTSIGVGRIWKYEIILP